MTAAEITEGLSRLGIRGLRVDVEDGRQLQDQAVTESMGAITDHAYEHLAPSDQMVTRTRRRLLLAARALRENGALPPGVKDPDVFRGARSGYFISEDASPWQEMLHNRHGSRRAEIAIS
jgi:hypothetical protein